MLRHTLLILSLVWQSIGLSAVLLYAVVYTQAPTPKIAVSLALVWAWGVWITLLGW